MGHLTLDDVLTIIALLAVAWAVAQPPRRRRSGGQVRVKNAPPIPVQDHIPAAPPRGGHSPATTGAGHPEDWRRYSRRL